MKIELDLTPEQIFEAVKAMVKGLRGTPPNLPLATAALQFVEKSAGCSLKELFDGADDIDDLGMNQGPTIAGGKPPKIMKL